VSTPTSQPRPTPPQSTPAPDTRTRILGASAALFQRQGYNATGVKQIVTEAQAPFGSVYHHFPGGKEEIAAAAIRISGGVYEQLIPAVFDAAPDLPTGVRWFFAGAAAHLVETDYAVACPIATVTLETANVSEPLREACAAVFDAWIAAGTLLNQQRAGLAPATARRLSICLITSLEGAFVLARAQRSTEPLEVAGELVAQAVERELA
jgi:AcrR family transcriptional regulator